MKKYLFFMFVLLALFGCEKEQKVISNISYVVDGHFVEQSNYTDSPASYAIHHNYKGQAVFTRYDISAGKLRIYATDSTMSKTVFSDNELKVSYLDFEPKLTPEGRSPRYVYKTGTFAIQRYDNREWGVLDAVFDAVFVNEDDDSDFKRIENGRVKITVSFGKWYAPEYTDL